MDHRFACADELGAHRGGAVHHRLHFAERDVARQYFRPQTGATITFAGST